MTGRDIDDRVRREPTLGFFYTVRPGDTLLAIAGRASGAAAGQARLAAARVINDAAYNDRFRGAANKLFPRGLVSLLPRFAATANEQAAVDERVPGRGYAALWLAAHPGHEPELEPEPESEPAPGPAPKPKPTPTRDDADRRVIDWEELHGGLRVMADHSRVVFFRPETIPIIIIPGIAGSALDHAVEQGPGRPGWPVNNLWKMLILLISGPRAKRRNLIGKQDHDPDYLRVIGGNKIVPENEHGLVGVAKSKYKDFVKLLLERNDARADTQKSANTPRTFFYFRTPPHCFGYNWTADIRLSGASLLEFWERLRAYYRGKKARCDRFILVTHSTGGLVARSALQQRSTFADEAFAVYHVGVPHVGAAEAYYRMKAGFPKSTPADKLVSWATMRSGNEAVALLGNMPGGLQLLPSTSYRTNDNQREWLALDFGSEAAPLRYPRTSPYRSIYTSEEPTCGLIDKRWLNPASRLEQEKSFEVFKDYIALAEVFHQHIQSVEFASAVQVTSQGIPTPDEVRFSCTSSPKEIRKFKRRHPGKERFNRGKFEGIGQVRPGDDTMWYVELEGREGEGDATVPISVASGHHFGGKFPRIQVQGVPHADMLKDTRCQQEILDSIEDRLERRIVGFERMLRRKA